MKKYILSFILFFPLISSVVQAQTLTIDECLDMALRENKEVKAAEMQAQQYMYTSKSLKSNYFPRISLAATDLYSTFDGSFVMDVASPISSLITSRVTEMFPLIASSRLGSWYLSSLADRFSPLNPEMDYKIGNIVTASVQLEQPVYMGGKINAGYRMGKLGESMARLGVEISEDEIVLKTYEAYALVNKAKEMRTVALQYDSLLVQVYNTVGSAARNGMARQADLMKVQAAKSKSDLQIHQAENGLKLAIMNLCQIIGLPLISKIDVVPFELAVDTRNDVFVFDVSERKEYELLDMQARLAEQKVKLEQSDYMPQVGIAISGMYLQGGEFDGNPLFRDKIFGTVAVSLKVPIFHAGEGSRKIAAARAEYEQARLEQANLNEMMELEIQKAINELDEAELEVDLNRKLMDEAEECLRTSQKAYSHGMETISDFLTSQTEWQNAYAEYVESRHNLVLKQINLRKVTGNLGLERSYLSGFAEN